MPRRPGPPRAHPQGEDAEDRQAGHRSTRRRPTRSSPALEVFPPDNPWNLVVEDWPLHPNSKNIVASIGADKPLRYNPDMGFVLVPPDQKKIDVKLVEYPDESDKGPYPVPDNVPIEGWPAYYTRDPKLQGPDARRRAARQARTRTATGTRIVVDPANRMLYEFYQLKKTDARLAGGVRGDLRPQVEQAPARRLDLADAAGLPIFPAVVRYDELKRGVDRPRACA